MKNIAMILSSGSGQRFGSVIPKQYNLIKGKMVVEYVIESVLKAKSIDDVVFVATNLEYARPLCEKYNMKLTTGGNTRSISIASGFDYIKENYKDVDKVIVFDSARPFVDPKVIEEYIGLLDEHDAVITTQRITDSLGNYKNANINREEFFLIQTPEAFRFNIIYKYFNRTLPITSIVQQMPEGSNVYPYFGIKNNMKITYPNDLEIAEILMKEKE